MFNYLELKIIIEKIKRLFYSNISIFIIKKNKKMNSKLYLSSNLLNFLRVTFIQTKFNIF